MKHNIDLARKLRRNPTWAERALWRELRNRRFAVFKFRRQYPIGPYVLDFYCVRARLAIELDGDPHGWPRQQAHDLDRSADLAKERIRVLRFWNVDIKENLEGVLATILAELKPGNGWNPHPGPLPPQHDRAASRGLASPCTTRERGSAVRDSASG